MRADLLLSQPNIGRGVRLALQITAGAAALYGAAVGLFLWTLNTTLQREQAAQKTTRQQASEARSEGRHKREQAAQMGRINAALPDGSGSAELTEELYRLASSSGAHMLGVVFQKSEAPPAPPPPPSGDVAVTSSNGANGSKNGSSNAPADPDAGEGWTRAHFECNLSGSFPSLDDFLDRMAQLPRVVEISGIEMHREPVDSRTGAVRVRLKVMGSVFGKAGKP